MRHRLIGIVALVLSILTLGCGQEGNGPAVASLESVAGAEPSLPDDGFLPASPTGDTNCIDRTKDAVALRRAREEVCAIANSERKKVGAGPLVLEAARSKVAQSHATDMYTRGYFSHDSPEGESPSDRLAEAGISWRTWGENIAKNPGDPSDVMTQWMNSSGHKANILNKSFKRLGVGFDHGHWVQVFTD